MGWVGWFNNGGRDEWQTTDGLTGKLVYVPEQVVEYDPLLRRRLDVDDGLEDEGQHGEGGSQDAHDDDLLFLFNYCCSTCFLLSILIYLKKSVQQCCQFFAQTEKKNRLMNGNACTFNIKSAKNADNLLYLFCLDPNCLLPYPIHQVGGESQEGGPEEESHGAPDAVQDGVPVVDDVLLAADDENVVEVDSDVGV